ncbi:hypothetical protein IGW14_03920 [Streptomyces hygroscopicus subsp. hygroscopicus]|nr:hypothetical protein [Streptomyces hygroscopicus]MBW8087213.1 hypothetical protein [Streptomyces hygroscopicus subsp. hygroscopicus]
MMVKTRALELPPQVWRVMVPAPVASPPGTVATSWVALMGVNTAVAVAAALSVKVTVSTLAKPVPLMVIWSPAVPVAGTTEVMAGAR